MAKDVHGDSDPPPVGFHIGDAARTVVSFLDALGAGLSHVLGQHTGAAIAAEMAALYPDRVEKLVLVGSPDWGEEKRVRLRQKKSPAVELNMDGSHLLEVWEQRRHLATDSTSVEIMHRAAMSALQALWWWPTVHHWVEDQYLTKRLPLIRSPTLFMCGEHDTMVRHLDRHKSLLQQGTPTEKVLLAGTGDFAAMEKPKEFAQSVLNFFES